MMADRLFINNTKFEANTLDKLPSELQPARYGSKIINDDLFFFSQASPLSNFHPSPFMIDGLDFSCGEQYIQWKKATIFECNAIAAQILTSTNPSHMKRLGSKVTNFNPSVWREAAPEIAKVCALNKFQQNLSLKEYLLSTNGKKLYEAAPNDSLWGIGVGISDPELSQKKRKWGANILGLALEDVRRSEA
jgi:ribA/ribD-fused uncharacterized protein